MRKIDWRHPACLWRHWEVWQYNRSIDKWKGYKLRERYEVTKKVRSYEKGTKLRKRYEVTKKVRSYEKGTKLRKMYKYVTKGLGYEVTKLRDSNATYRDNLLWRRVMHYGEMPRATLGSNDLRSQVATSIAYLKKTVQLTKSWKTIKNKLAQMYLHPME